MRWLLIRLSVVVALLPLAAMAQDKAQTLADVKAQLATLAGEFTALKQELVTTGAAKTGAAGGDALQRLDAIEAQLTTLTAKTEAVELKLNKVVTDGTNRIGDMQFQLCELTKGCDPSNLPATPVLGGAAQVTPPAKAPPAKAPPAKAPPAKAPGTTTTPDTTVPGATVPGATLPDANAPEMAVNEQSDFDRAKAALASGDFRTAAALFATYAQSYPGGPLVPEAGVLRGDALTKLGDTAKAARSYLDAFSGAPQGKLAGQALTKLGTALGTLGQKNEACVTLTEVGKRFPGTEDDTRAKAAMQGLGCS